MTPRLAALLAVALAWSLGGAGCISIGLYDGTISTVGDRHATLLEDATVEEDAAGPLVRLALSENGRRHTLLCRPGRAPEDAPADAPAGEPSARPWIRTLGPAQRVCMGDLVSLFRPDGTRAEVFVGATPESLGADLLHVSLEPGGAFVRLHRAPPGGRAKRESYQPVEPGATVLDATLALEEPRLVHPGKDVGLTALWILAAPVALALDVATSPLQGAVLLVYIWVAPGSTG